MATDDPPVATWRGPPSWLVPGWTHDAGVLWESWSTNGEAGIGGLADERLRLRVGRASELAGVRGTRYDAGVGEVGWLSPGRAVVVEKTRRARSPRCRKATRS